MYFKVHIEHDPTKAPPERPICSGCGSAFENVSQFIDHHIKEISTRHPKYLQETPDFLRYLEKALLATFDIVGLFTNIPHDDGIEAVREALEEQTDKETSTEFVIRLLN